MEPQTDDVDSLLSVTAAVWCYTSLLVTQVKLQSHKMTFLLINNFMSVCQKSDKAITYKLGVMHSFCVASHKH